MLMKVILVAGARPNFMKVAPVLAEMNRHPSHFEPILLHTGQHYDYEMSKVFFEDLDLPAPHYSLGVGSGTHAEQTARIMIEFEKVLVKEKPNWVVVFGDVNSTLACSLTAKKLFIPVAHVEAGLRSFDMTMPEEINRKLTDVVSDLLFTPSIDGSENLIREGITGDRIHFVGNIMIDSLVSIQSKIDPSFENRTLEKYRLRRKQFVLVTLHRPSNVDDHDSLWKIMASLKRLSQEIPILFPVHPRTKKNINEFEVGTRSDDMLNLVEPLGYKEFITLEKDSALVLTDSGGIQEETTFFRVPCLTLRPNTERPITLRQGTNELVSLENVEARMGSILSGERKHGAVPELWDGKTAQRIGSVIKTIEIEAPIGSQRSMF
jgi:UDP-N-acetylglucosamine 2-epimerase (non-hydrolysing)